MRPKNIAGEIMRDRRNRICHDENRRAEIDWLRRSESDAKLSAAINLLKGRPGVSVHSNEFDDDAFHLNFLNGTLDLRDGSLRAHCPNDKLTRVIPFDFDSEAECPRFIDCLNRCLRDDQDLIPYLQRYIGYTACGSPREEVLIMLPLSCSDITGSTCFSPRNTPSPFTAITF